MYVGEGLTLREIGEKIGASRQTVCNILQDVGIRAAQKGKRPDKRRTAKIDAKIRRLYVHEDKPITEIAEILHLPGKVVTESLRSQNITIKRGGTRTIAYPELRKIEIGESLVLPRVGNTRVNTYARYYIMAKVAGIRVSVRAIDADKMRVTRKA